MAARPHGSNTASRDWSVGPHEPYWRTNTSFSPPPSRWDFRFQSERLPYGSHEGIQLYGSSTSSNSKESQSWVRGNYLYNNQYSASDGTGLFISSPSDLSQGPQWTPPAIQEINVDDYETETRRGIVIVHPFHCFHIMMYVCLCLRRWLIKSQKTCCPLASFSVSYHSRWALLPKGVV